MSDMPTEVDAFYDGLSSVLDVAGLEEPGDRFKVGELLGEGTYGEVYEAIDTKTDKSVAIKMIENVADNIDEIEEEYSALSTHWIHPNIPCLEGVFLKRSLLREHDQFWLVQELCKGGSVTDLVSFLHKKSLPGLTELEIAYVLSEVAKTLKYLHSNHTLHRDVKGSNILLHSDGEVMLVDYGVACKLDVPDDCEENLGEESLQHIEQKRHTAVGTPYWMAPEVILCDSNGNEGYDSRCDVWSLGITAIELAEGKAPLCDIHPMRALFQIPRNPPPTLTDSTIWSKEFQDFVHECLVKDYEERPIIAELLEHPFLQSVPDHPTFIKHKLETRLKELSENIRSNDNKTAKAKLDATARNGRLKTQRLTKGKLMLRDDLAGLNFINEDILLDNLRRHFHRGQIYVYVGEILLSLNPCRELNIYTPREMLRYRNRSKFDNPPHAFAMANHAYQAMLHERRNQRFLITGESGAGKTVASNVIVKMLVYMGRAPNRNLEDKILQINPILEAFGNAATATNSNSSRFAKVIELSYSKIGKLTGAKISAYLLEQARVVSNTENFHVFRYVLSNLDEKIKGENLDEKYIIASNTKDEDAAGLKILSAAFALIGIRPPEQEAIYKIVLAVHLLRQVQFESGLSDGSRPTDANLCNEIARLLDIGRNELLSTLTTSSFITKGDVTRRNNSPREALTASRALAKSLYDRLFDFVVNSINELFAHSRNVYGESANIGVLDVFGFENLEHGNSLEQLCVNTANEQLNFHFHQFLFCWEKEEYAAEGIVVRNMDTALTDNRSALDLVLGRPLGVLAVLDEESRLFDRNGSFDDAAEKFVRKIGDNLSRFPCLETKASDFCIRHYAQKIEYSGKDFVAKNCNYLAPQTVFVMRTSKQAIVKFMFSSPLGQSGHLEHKSNNGKVLERQFSQSRTQQTAATYFRYSLRDLMQLTLNGSPHFVRCFKPNRNISIPNFDDDFMTRQLRYTGVLQIVAARQEGYSYRMTFGEFLRRYCFLGFSFDERVLATKENCQLLLLRLRMDDYALGHTKVFLKYYHVEYLSKEYERQIRKIIRVQASVRRWLAALKCQREKWAVARNIFLMKIFAVRWKRMVQKRRRPSYRMNSKENEEEPKDSQQSVKKRSKSTAAVEIQRHIRGYFARKKIGALLAKKLSSAVECKDEKAIEEVKQELHDEGLTPDEAARLIQSVYKKVKLKKIKSKDSMKKQDITAERKSIFDHEMLEVMKHLMQCVHMNNLHIHKCFKEHKTKIDLAEVKTGLIRVFPDKIIQCLNTFKLDKVEPLPSLNKDPQRDQAALGSDLQMPSGAEINFYADEGPEENWDAPLEKLAKEFSRPRKGRKSSAAATTTYTSAEAITPSQAFLAASQTQQFFTNIKSSILNSAAPIEPCNPTINNNNNINNNNPKPLGQSVSYIDHLNSLRKPPNGSQEDNDDDGGVFDFRSLLKKTDFAPTASMKRRKGGKNNEPPSIPVLRPVKASVSTPEISPNLDNDEYEAVDL